MLKVAELVFFNFCFEYIIAFIQVLFSVVNMETYRYFEEQRMLMECLVKGGGGGGRKNLENMEMMRSVYDVCLIMKNSFFK